MVPLPLFKLASLFVRQVSKYGANRIKAQAHDHPGFRHWAAKYGQALHQLNMRLSVALLRNPEAEQRAKEKAEAPRVKTKEQVEKEAELRAKHGVEAVKPPPPAAKEAPQPQSIWRRKFRPLPEAKAVDLFADMIGDAFILGVAISLVFYEYWRSAQKPDQNAERIRELGDKLDELKRVEEERARAEDDQGRRLRLLEDALRNVRDPKTKQPLVPALQTA